MSGVGNDGRPGEMARTDVAVVGNGGRPAKVADIGTDCKSGELVGACLVGNIKPGVVAGAAIGGNQKWQEFVIVAVRQ